MADRSFMLAANTRASGYCAFTQSPSAGVSNCRGEAPSVGSATAVTVLPSERSTHPLAITPVAARPDAGG